MVCIQCGSETQVINSRPQKRLNQIWRRRQCINCSSIFSTHEVADYSAVWLVKLQSSKFTSFQRDKLFLSLLESCKHRKTALTDAGALANTVTSKLQPLVVDGIIHSDTIARTVQVVLNRFDGAASVHYQAFHPYK